MKSALFIVLAASAPGGDSTDWALVLGVIGTALGVSGLLWNIYNVVSDRRARSTPDVHGAVLSGPSSTSSLAFVNAGQGVARSVQYLFYEPPYSVMGGPGVGFLLSEQQAEVDLGFVVREVQSNMIWLFMDVQGRVYARSNHGGLNVHPKGASVSLRDTFAEMYPGVELPPGIDHVVGE